MHQPSLLAAFTAVLASVPSAQAGMYTKNSPVLQLDHKNFNDEIMKTNYTSIVEFYAPWCGHCQNLKPAYEKAARNLDGLAKVAAIDCDDDANKQICGTHGVQGFPTLKTFKPGSKKYPIVEDYRGQRTASAITDEVVNKINNHVTRVTGKDVDDFLAKEGPKALLFTEKGTTSALLRSIAIDYLSVINVGQVRSKESDLVEKFGIEKFPTLVLVPEGEGAEPIVYDGEMKKKDMINFLKQAGEPNPDPKPKDSKKAKKKAEPAPEPEEAPESSSATSTTENAASTSIPIETITSSDMLEEKCFQPKSHTCLLALTTSDSSENGEKVIESLSKLNAKYIQGKHHLFPFFALPGSIDSTASVRSALELSGEVELIAINARRSWWRQYEGDFSVESVEAWIDAIRMGEGGKKKLPENILVEKTGSNTEEPVKEETETETKATDPEPEVETEAPEPVGDEKIVHEEL